VSRGGLRRVSRKPGNQFMLLIFYWYFKATLFISSAWILNYMITSTLKLFIYILWLLDILKEKKQQTRVTIHNAATSLTFLISWIFDSLFSSQCDRKSCGIKSCPRVFFSREFSSLHWGIKDAISDSFNRRICVFNDRFMIIGGGFKLGIRYCFSFGEI